MNDEKAYQFGKSRLIIKFGDITSAMTDVIVSADDAYLSMGGGVSASILCNYDRLVSKGRIYSREIH